MTVTFWQRVSTLVVELRKDYSKISILTPGHLDSLRAVERVGDTLTKLEGVLAGTREEEES